MADADEMWAGADAALARWGLPAAPASRSHIVAELEEQIRLEADERGDSLLMRLLCAQLFSIGNAADSLVVWRAKECNFDTHCGIDVQLLCGAGLEATKSFLQSTSSEGAAAALDYLRHCEACDDFAEFAVARTLSELQHFYRPGAPE